MALMGKAQRYRTKQASTSTPAPPDPWSWMRFAKGGETKPTKRDIEGELKESYSWLKDAYVFAKNNKDNLEDPDVREILQTKLQKLERAGYFTPIYKTDKVGSDRALMGGDPMFKGPEVDMLGSYQALQQRFMMENPSIYKPQQIETMGQATPGGPMVPGTRMHDPMTEGKPMSGFFQAQPKIMTKGSEMVQPTLSPTGQPSLRRYGGVGGGKWGGVEFDANLGRWTQTSPEGKVETITSGDDLAKMYRGNDKPLIPNSVYNANINNAIKDAVTEYEQNKPGMVGQFWNWLKNNEESVWTDYIKPRLDEYNNMYLKSQGTPADTGRVSPKPDQLEKEEKPKRKPLGAFFSTPQES